MGFSHGTHLLKAHRSEVSMFAEMRDHHRNRFKHVFITQKGVAVRHPATPSPGRLPTCFQALGFLFWTVRLGRTLQCEAFPV